MRYIVDNDYSLEKMKKKNFKIDFLNSLTDFFYDFHVSAIHIKDELEKFDEKRANVIKRFNNSSIDVYDLTVVPNSDNHSYQFNPRPLADLKSYEKKLDKSFRQIPFTRVLKFTENIIENQSSNIFFLCSSRIEV